jgi:tRNA (guanine-N7-)-methyltransferase
MDFQPSSIVKGRHRRHANPFTIRGPIEVPEWSSLFGRTAPMALDIGCGPGMFALELAKQNPQWNVVGLEIRRHLTDHLNACAHQEGVSNVCGFYANANVHLDVLVPDQSVVFASINFPDPWYKKRHHKRRVVQKEWLQLLHRKMMPGAYVHTMTDYAPIGADMHDVFLSTPGFVASRRDGFLESSTTGIVSERELKHMSRGETIYRMKYEVVSLN